MAGFRFEAYDAAGNLKHGKLEAQTRTHAQKALLAQGLTAVLLEDTAPEPRRCTKPLSLARHALLCRSLGSHLKNGLPLTRALSILSSRTPDAMSKGAFEAVRHDVESGRSLAAALRASGCFREDLSAIVEAGERGGALGDVLSRAHRLYRLEMETSRKIRKALLYPSAMLAVGLGVTAFLLTVVVPRLSGLFEEMGQNLPLVTRILLAVAAVFRVAGLPAALILGAMGWQLYRRGRLPMFRGLRERISLSMILSHLGVLLDCGVPITTALETSAGLDRKPERWLRVSEEIKKGVPLSRALDETGAISEEVRCVLEMGDGGSELAEALKTAGEAAWEDAEEAVERITELAEPTLILLLGAIVGFVVIAVLLPIFDLSSLLH
jgi:type II secretory pathway component PulF